MSHVGRMREETESSLHMSVRTSIHQQAGPALTHLRPVGPHSAAAGGNIAKFGFDDLMKDPPPLPVPLKLVVPHDGSLEL